MSRFARGKTVCGVIDVLNGFAILTSAHARSTRHESPSQPTPFSAHLRPCLTRDSTSRIGFFVWIFCKKIVNEGGNSLVIRRVYACESYEFINRGCTRASLCRRCNIPLQLEDTSDQGVPGVLPLENRPLQDSIRTHQMRWDLGEVS